MKIAITGGSGLIGTALEVFLRASGHEIVVFKRKAKIAKDLSGGPFWDAYHREIDRAALRGVDAVINLSGEGIAEGRWTSERKKKLVESRVVTTAFLAETLAGLASKPSVLINASAIGYYGDRGEEIVDESSAAGAGFLPDTCQLWEAATAAAERAGIRVVHLRTGVVLSQKGGALSKMLPPFRAGAGGPIGSGRQWMSFIALDDLLRVVLFCIDTPVMRGALNAVSPHAVTNAEFTRTLARLLHRPAVIPLPRFAVKAMFGEMGEAVLLEGAHVRPSKLISAGFEFRYARLEDALKHAIVKESD